MRLIYNFCFLIFAVLYLPVFLLKGKHKDGFGSRLGHVPQGVREYLSHQRVVWVHAVSVGEVIQAVRLVNHLRQSSPGTRFLFTTTTATGLQVVNQLKNEEDTALYFPIDLRSCIERFIKAVTPNLVVILETEIWPNLIIELSERKIPVFIVNGRVSDKAMPKYRAIKFFIGPVLNRLQGIGAQDERMKARFQELGAGPEIVTVTGNMKFDWAPQPHAAQPSDAIIARIRRERSFLWIAGSTHSGEEELLFDIYGSIKAGCPDLVLLIAPRHPERIESIERKAAQRQIVVTRVSGLMNRTKEEGPVSRPEGTVYLLDMMGVLAGLYRGADAVFMGGSLVKVGGHNLVEPAYFEKPVLCGPFMGNFRQMADEFKKAGAAIEVKDAKELTEKIIQFYREPQYARSIGAAAKQLVIKHQGATDRTARLFEGLKPFAEPVVAATRVSSQSKEESQ